MSCVDACVQGRSRLCGNGECTHAHVQYMQHQRAQAEQQQREATQAASTASTQSTQQVWNSRFACMRVRTSIFGELRLCLGFLRPVVRQNYSKVSKNPHLHVLTYFRIHPRGTRTDNPWRTQQTYPSRAHAHTLILNTPPCIAGTGDPASSSSDAPGTHSGA